MYHIFHLRQTIFKTQYQVDSFIDMLHIFSTWYWIHHKRVMVFNTTFNNISVMS